MKPGLAELGDLIALQTAAVDRNDWKAFTEAQSQAQQVIDAVGPLDAEDQSAIETLIAKVEDLQRRLATRHDMTSHILQYLRARKGTGQAIDTTY